MKRFAMMTLAIVLSCLMVIYMIPTQVYAYGAEALREALSSEETEAPTEETATSAIDTDPNADVRMEVSELRTATGKTFLMDDGSYRVVEYGSAVHYSDGDAWQDIDNTLSENTDSDGSGFVAENAARVKFANNTASSKLLSIKNGNYQISFGLVGGNKTRAGVVTNPETPEYDESVTKYEQLSTLTKLVSKVTYPEVFDNTTLEYVLVGDKIKENFVLSGRSDDGYTYTFEMKLNKLTAALQADGSILLSDEETAEAVYILPAPVYV